MRPSYKFQLLWHALMTFCTMLIVIYWRAFRATSNFYLSAAVVTLFMMALQSVSATSAAWTWEGDLHTQEGSITFGQGWVGFSTLMYTVGAATHLGMMCAWRHIDIDAYEAVPMGVLKGGFVSSNAEGSPPPDSSSIIGGILDDGHDEHQSFDLPSGRKGSYGSDGFH
eukprot:CAMPEP_0170179502 /NCGR_PEP_ID=MMETSP0040_2-20121228/18064_1 /TAXON_ID=641309 /ORGANISM="Lotharella oceanica, Strain CCMP622" /LENGTH=167 /DNA_ID=CAMNT_0010423641 /DNA_START=90 /DNA_END=593 /DNA_ORIENTATION=-